MNITEYVRHMSMYAPLGLAICLLEVPVTALTYLHVAGWCLIVCLSVIARAKIHGMPTCIWLKFMAAK